jgi:hypothetical protein
MNKKLTKKSKKARSSPVADVGATPLPDPKTLAGDAEKEQRIVAARDYIETINILRDKKSYSFRDIAAWFNARGVPLDNNEVYRAYMAGIHPMEKEQMAQSVALPDPED